MRLLLCFLLLWTSNIFAYSTLKLPKATIAALQVRGILRTNVQTFNQIPIATNVNYKDIFIVNKSTNGYPSGFYQRQGNNWALIQKLNFSTNTNTGASVNYTTVSNISKKIATNVVTSLSITSGSASNISKYITTNQIITRNLANKSIVTNISKFISTNISKYITTNQILIRDLTSKTTVSNITRYFITNGKLMLNITLIAHDSIRNPQMGDIICDGTNDEVSFMSAVAIVRNSTVSGARIDFSDGSFHFGATGYARWLNSGEYIISGAGTAVTTIYADDGSNCDILFVSSTNGKNTFFKIQDLTIFGNRANNATGGRGIVNKTSKDFLISRVFFYNLHGTAVFTTNCWNTKAQDCIVEDSDAKGFLFINGQDGGVINCKILNMVSNSIDCNASSCDISGNYIWIYSPQNKAINMGANASYSVISKNRIVDVSTGSNSTAIQVASDRNSISENIVVGQGYLNVGYKILGGADANRGTGNVAYVIAGTNIINSGSSNTIQINGNFIGNHNFSGANTFGDGGTANFARFNSTGDLSFTNSADMMVGMNRYFVRYSGDEDAGMFFSTTADGVISFKDTNGVEAVYFGVVSGANSGNAYIGGKLTTASSHVEKTTYVSARYTILSTDRNIFANTSLSSFSNLLPASTTVGQVYDVKNIGTGVLTIDGNGGKIDGVSYTNIRAGKGITLKCYTNLKWGAK
ncbi:MAG: hypothetical protein PHP92_04930 [Candidatus Nanoarchaeia archaeon]|nr:hypothetical protein [Candidatus Nanoarchaeia archaeon]